MEKKVEESLLVSLIYSLSLFNLVEMKTQLLFFSSQENFLKKRRLAMGAHFNFALMFSFRVSGKNALGN